MSDKGQYTIAELREENARLRAALKPVLECKVISAMTVETGKGKGEYCAAIIEKAQRIYNEGDAALAKAAGESEAVE